jgi:hypothetical protein
MKKMNTRRILNIILAMAILICFAAGYSSSYADASNWLARPSQILHDADVFYLYPTTVAPDAPLVSTIFDEVMRAGAQNAFNNQATAFETVANIFAPFYKQVNFELAPPEELFNLQRKASRESVFLALDYYFENLNNGRPFFLAGHSQGAASLTFVLEEYMVQHPERYENMIAAYMIGNAPTRDWLATNPHIRFAEGADDIGVVISWNTEAPGNIGQPSFVIPEGSVAINPLNWRTDETYAGVEENLGSFLPNENGVFRLVIPGIADARVDVARGSVISESVDPAVYSMPAGAAIFFGAESYHQWDFEYYYLNIRENARLRMNRFLETH